MNNKTKDNLRIKLIAYIVLIFFLFLPFFANSQNVKGEKKKTIIRNEKLNIKNSSEEQQDEAVFDFADVDLETLLEMESSEIASKRKQKLTEVPATVTVITQDDITARPFTTIPDLLRSYAGFLIQQINRHQYIVGTRGTAPIINPRLLMLLDGRLVYDDTFGHIPWQTLPVALNDIKRIEIVKGPSSTLYGANAVCGVINIITHKGNDQKGLKINTASGINIGDKHNSYDKKVHFSFGYTNKSKTLDIYSSFNFSSLPEYVDISKPPWNIDLSKYKDFDEVIGNSAHFSGLFKAAYEVNENINMEIDLAYVEKISPIVFSTIDPLQIVETYDYSGSAKLIYDSILNENSKLTIQYDFRSQELDLSNQKSRSVNTVMNHVGLQLDIPENDLNTTTIGVNIRIVYPHSNALNSLMDQALSHSVYAQHETRFLDNFIFNTGFRFDYITTGKKEIESVHYSTNPRASLIYIMDENNSFRFNFAYAFRMPTIQEQFGADLEEVESESLPGIPDRPWLIGNPRLKPETMFSGELSYTGKVFENIRLEGTVFYQKLNDQIGIPKTIYMPQTLFNITDIEFWGSEISIMFLASKIAHIYSNFTFNYAFETQSKKVIEDWPNIIANFGGIVKPVKTIIFSSNLNLLSKRTGLIYYRKYMDMGTHNRTIVQSKDNAYYLDVKLRYKPNPLFSLGITASKLLSLIKNEEEHNQYYNTNNTLNNSILPIGTSVMVDISLSPDLF